MSDWQTRITQVQEVEGDAEPSGPGCLVQIYPPGPNMGKRFPLEGKVITLGRSAECGIEIDRDSVSRHHASIRRTEDGWLVEDNNSTNGTYINDLQIQTGVLSDSDLLKIGSVIFKFLSGTGIETAYHEEIYRMTIVDGLTGAHNKRYFLEFLEREIARCARYGRPLSLLMFDVDDFRSINNDRGHLTGDFVLREMVRRLEQRIRKEELLARYGGEEFAVVLPETDAGQGVLVGEKLRSLISDEPFAYDGETFQVTISVGAATIEGEEKDVLAFIKLADDNLYRAKRNGKNQVVGSD